MGGTVFKFLENFTKIITKRRQRDRYWKQIAIMSNVKVSGEELAACFAAGIFLHLTVFRYGEWDAHSFTLLEVAAGVQVALTLFAHEVFSESTIASIQHVIFWAGAAIAGLLSSMVVYRAFFHRLRHFPGPLPARLSTFYMTYLSFKRGQIYEDVRALHQKYGDYVRVGPSEISIADPAAFNAIHSATSQCERGPWYNILNPTVSLQMVRDRKEHARRRKAWDRAFNPKGKCIARDDSKNLSVPCLSPILRQTHLS